MAVKKEDVALEVTFTKEQIVHSERYKHKQDAVNAVLKDDQSYTLNEVDDMIENLMKEKVR